MRRRIIQQGHGTLTVTLPKKWTTSHNVLAGTEVDVVEKEGMLAITPVIADGVKSTEISIDGMSIPNIWKYMMSIYREGYTKVKINFSPQTSLENPYLYLTKHRLMNDTQPEKKNIVERLQGFVDRFIGFEIIEHGRDFIIIAEMTSPNEKEFDNALRRIFLLLNQMAQETSQAIKDGDNASLVHISSMDVSVDKFHDYCYRILNLLKHKRNGHLYLSTLNFLELIGDEFKNIAVHLYHDSPKKSFKRIEPVANSIRNQLELYYTLFYTFDQPSIERLSEIDKKEYLAIPAIYLKCCDEEKEILHHFRIISRYLNQLLELRIQMEY